MKIVTLLNEKGGVGKTTLATHIAAGLAIRGLTVILVDSDAQGHATVSLGLNKEPGLYDLLVRDATFEQTLRHIAPDVYSDEPVPGNLLVLPSNVETRVIPEIVSNAMLFHDRFHELEGVADVVIVDTSPTPNLLHGIIYLATDSVLYPTECESLSLDGLAGSLRHREQASAMRSDEQLEDIKVIGIQPTMYEAKTLAHDYGLKLLAQNFKRLLWPAIPSRTIWKQAAWGQKTLFKFAPNDVAAQEAWALVERVEASLS